MNIQTKKAYIDLGLVTVIMHYSLWSEDEATLHKLEFAMANGVEYPLSEDKWELRRIKQVFDEEMYVELTHVEIDGVWVEI